MLKEENIIKCPSLEEKIKNRKEQVKMLANEMQELVSQLNS